MNTMNRGRCMAVVAVAFSVSTALAQNAPVAANSQPKDDDLKEVVVTGIRASLEQAADIKRKADVIVDSIATEDLGKFPEANVAESLQRITGVTINRDAQGEGSQITVRGFGPAFNRVLVNGRWFPSSTGGAFGSAPTGFGFDALPAELLSGADVYKSSSATLQDGGIGALINIRTARPFDFKGPRAVVSAKEVYEDLSGRSAPQAFALLSDTWADNRVGALVSFSFQERHARTDSGGVSAWLPNQTVSYTDAGGTHTLASNVFFPTAQTYEVTNTDLRRVGLTGALQFQPNDQLLLSLDGLYNRYRTSTQEYQLSHYFTADNITNVTVGANNTVTALTTNQFGHTDFTRLDSGTPTVLSAIGFNTNWKSAGNRLNLTFDLADSKSINNGVDTGGFAVAGYRNVINWSSTGGMPSLVASGIPGMGIPAGTFTDTSVERAHFVSYGGGTHTVDEAREARLDGVFNADAGMLAALKFGAYYSDRKYESSTFSILDFCQFCGYYFPLPASLFSVFDAGSGFLGGGAPSQWLSFDPNAYVAYLRQATGNPSLYTPVAGAGPSIVQEKVQAVYLQLDLAGQIASRPWSANLGLRGVRTSLDSSGYSQLLTDLSDIPGDPTAYNATYANNGAYVYVAANHHYNNLLPSLNTKLEITDRLIARFAASKTLTRPSLNSLSPVISYAFILRPNNLTASSGNPDLRPYLSTNFDLSLEWYYKRGGYVTLAGFSKTVDDYIVTQFVDVNYPIGNSSGDFPNGYAPFRVSQPVNVEKAKITGIEVAVQHTFDTLPAPFDGFGVGVNATFVHSPSTLSPGNTDTSRSFALEGVGDSQNAMIFYEKGPVGIRASYNHRDDYLQSTAGTGNEPVFVRSRGQLDVQASYRIGQHVTVTLEGTNITDEPQEEFGRFRNQFIQRQETGARYALGVRANF